MSVRSTAMYWNRKRNRAARNRQAFDALVAEPVTDLTGFSLPAGTLLGVRSSEAIEDGDLTVTIGSEEFNVPALPADVLHLLGFHSTGVGVAFSGTASGTIDLCVLDDWRRAKSVAQVEL